MLDSMYYCMYLYIPVDPIITFPMYPVLSHMSFSVCVCVSNLRAQHTASTLPHIFPACMYYSMYWYAFALCLIDLHSTLEPQVWAESSTASFHKQVRPKLGYPKFTGYHVSPLKW